MTRKIWMKWALLAPLLLSGCHGFWDAASSSDSGGGSTTASSGNFYVLNVATDQVAGYYINAGNLTALPGSPYVVPGTPLSIAIAPNGGFLYIGTSNGIYVYTIATSGQLTLSNSSAPISADQAISMVVSPDNNWLLDVVSGAPYLYATAVNSTNGNLATANEKEQIAVLPSASVQQVAIAPDQSYAFATMGSGGTEVVGFATGNADPFGNEFQIPTVSSSGAALSVAVDPLQSGQTAPRLLYIGETAATSGSNSGGLRVFDYSTLGTSRKEITGSPFAISGLAPYSILPISTGNYVYVVNRQVSGSSTGVIAGFSIASASSTYSLTALGSTFTVGTNPVALAEDNTGTFVFAVDYGGSPDLKGYTFDATNAGYLDAVISGATGTDPVQASAIVAAP